MTLEKDSIQENRPSNLLWKEQIDHQLDCVAPLDHNA